MSDKKSELPRDLRTLCGGTVKDADGSERTLLFPIESYANISEVRKELEQAVSDPATSIKDLPPLREELKLVKRLQADLKKRILDHFASRPPASDPNAPKPRSVDHGAKYKVEKLLADVEAGRYDRRKKSKTLRAVMKAFAYHGKNGRMPSQGELKKLGFNDQQATDAGKWFARQADREPDGESLFVPLHKPQQGRPIKK
jgi:hypothetical protein